MVMSFFAIMLLSAHLVYSFLMQTLYLLQLFIQYTCCPANAGQKHTCYQEMYETKIIQLALNALSYPRHACPLKGAVLMQMHELALAAPLLVREGMKRVYKRMQNHVPCGCMA